MNETEVILVVEEAHLLVSRRKMARYDLGEPGLVRVLRMGRKHGVSCCVIDQVPGELDWAVQANLSSRMVLRVVNEACIRATALAMGLDAEQSAALAELGEREAVAQTARSPRPFQIRIVEMESREHAAEEELLERERFSLEILGHTEPETDAAAILFGKREPADAAVKPVRGDMHGVLARICQSPAETIEERCAALGLERAREYRARTRLVRLGMIARADRVGSKWQLFTATGKGKEWARAMGIRVASFKSGAGHEYMCRKVRDGIERSVEGAVFFPPGRSLGISGLQPDLLAGVRGEEGDTGFRVAVQVNSTNKPEYEARKAAELARIPQIDRVVIVARNKTRAGAIEVKLREMAEKEGIDVAGGADGAGGHGRKDEGPTHSQGTRGRVVVLDFETCASPEYDWSWVVEESRT